MKKTFLKKFFQFIILIILTLGVSISFQSLLAAWVAPTQIPPNANAPAPINEGTGQQLKFGKLVTGGGLETTGALAVVGGSILGNLEVKGVQSLTGATNANLISFKPGGTQKAVVGMSGSIKGTAAQDLGIFAETGQGIKFMTNGSANDVMTVGNDGNVSVNNNFSVTGNITVAGQNVCRQNGTNCLAQTVPNLQSVTTAGNVTTLPLYTKGGGTYSNGAICGNNGTQCLNFNGTWVYLSDTSFNVYGGQGLAAGNLYSAGKIYLKGVDLDTNSNGLPDNSDNAANSNTVGGLSVHAGRNNEANKIVRTDANGYIQSGWINTPSGDNGVTTPTKIYASTDDYIRYYTPANLKTALGLSKSGMNRGAITSNQNYWTGSQGWGAEDFNSLPNYGSTFFDVWDNPANEPPGTSHYQGVQAFHYFNGSTGYGSQLVFGSPMMNGSLFMRSIWGGGWSGWTKFYNDGYHPLADSAVTLSASGATSFSTNASGFHVINAEGTGSDVRVGAAWGRPGVYSNPNFTIGAEGAIYFVTGNVERGRIDSSGSFYASGKIYSASTVAGDAGTTATTKNYVDNKVPYFETKESGIVSIPENVSYWCPAYYYETSIVQCSAGCTMTGCEISARCVSGSGCPTAWSAYLKDWQHYTGFTNGYGYYCFQAYGTGAYADTNQCSVNISYSYLQGNWQAKARIRCLCIR